jgi:Polyketide cyclase / dehydrase and lipid transport
MPERENAYWPFASSALYVLLRARHPRFIRAGPQSEGEKRMRAGFLASAAMALALLCGPAQAAPEWTTILLEKVVDRTPDQTWAKIGPYCAIATWLKVTCQITTTSNQAVGVGANRRLNGRTDEVMVAATPYSYTYAQPLSDIQPESPIFYHGTLAVEPLERGRRTKIVYTLFYDQAPLNTTEAKIANREQRSKRFSDALQAMKEMAEAP